MNIRPEHLTALRNLGYTDTEARFLYLVATHSGYFTQRQYLDFSDHLPGSFVHRLTTKILKLRHARATSYAKNTHVYNLFSRQIYDLIDKDNLRNRRRQSPEMIHTRLMILDFILAHSHENYLETEADKIDYFTRQMGLSLTTLPGRIYYGIRSATNTRRYFVDRFPIFLPAPGNPFGLRPVVTFTYCDTPGTDLFSYLTHLRQYQPLLVQLPAFNLIFASPDRSRCDRAQASFAQIFLPRHRPSIRRLIHYFKLRKLWDTHHASRLTRADRDFLRAAVHEFEGQNYESAYRQWALEGLSWDQISALFPELSTPDKASFHTYIQPATYPIFWTESRSEGRSRVRDKSSDGSSNSFSTLDYQ
jgi:hypothetical protein